MQKPIKIIYKYQNRQNNTQYYHFIFLEKRYREIKDVLEKIANLPYDKCLISLTQNDFKKLVDSLSENWYTCLFNKHHLYLYTKKISKNPYILKLIKIDKEWVKKHVIHYEKTLKNVYSYSNILSYEEEYAEFVKNISVQKGGAPDIEEEDDPDNLNIFDDDDNDDSQENDKEGEEDAEEERVIEEINFDNDADIDQYEKSNRSSNDIAHKHRYVIKNESQKNMYLEEAFVKKYVWDCEIYMNDSINDIMEKFSYFVNAEHESNFHLTPTRLYLWSEYNSVNHKNIEYVSLTHNWIYRNTVLDLDIVPSNNKQTFLDLESNPKLNILGENLNNNSKLKCIDNRYKILNHFHDYIENNELYCIDIYSQLWFILTRINEDKATKLKNIDYLHNIFVKLYFPNCHKYFKSQIIPSLLEDSKIEYTNTRDIILTIKKKIESEIKINSILQNIPHEKKDVFITQAVFFCNLINIHNKYFNLKNIFNFYVLDDKVLYLKYQDNNETIVKKHQKIFDKITPDKYNEWNSQKQRGIIFKYLITKERFITIIFPKSGKLEIKLQWTEDDQTTPDQLSFYKNIIFKTIDKMKKDCDLLIKNPSPSNVHVKFVNSLQKVSLPSGINYNQFSCFTKYFHTIFSQVINLNDRPGAKKSASILRYKKISNYEDTFIIKKRIFYYLKNFEFKRDVLEKVIALEFSMQEKDARELIEKSQKKFSKMVVKNTRKDKKLLTLDSNIIKFKRGIHVSIYGKELNNYKIRIEGVKSLFDMDQITTYINKLIYLYESIYQKKNKKYRYILKDLESDYSSAKNRGLIIDNVIRNTSDKMKTLKNMKNNHSIIRNIKNSRYSRECQNSGEKIRRPTQILGENNLKLHGYKFNKEKGTYEKKIPGGVLYALKYENDIFYICDEKINKNRKYIGILSKTENDLPCCFLKNQMDSKNPEIKRIFENKVYGKRQNSNVSQSRFEIQNLAYIKTLKNKIQPTRFFMVPENVNDFLHKYFDKAEKNLLYGVSEDMTFLDVINIFLKKDDIYKSVISNIKDNIDEELLGSINKGLVLKQFGSKSNFIDNVKPDLDYEYFTDLVSIFYQVNILIFEELDSLNDNNKQTDFSVRITQKNISTTNFIALIKLNKYPSAFFPIVIHDGAKKIRELFVLKENDAFDNLLQSYKFDYSFYKSAGVNIVAQYICPDDKFIKYLISDKEECLPVSLFVPPYHFLKITKKPPIRTLPETLQYIQKKSEFMKTVAHIYSKKTLRITKVRVLVQNSMISLSSTIAVKPHPLNKYTPLELEESEVIVKNKTMQRHFKYEINVLFLKNELYNLFRFHFSKTINLPSFSATRKKCLKEGLNNTEIKNISKKFIHFHPKSFGEWCISKSEELVNLNLFNSRSLCSEKKNQILCSPNGKLTMFRDLFEKFIADLMNDIDFDEVKKKEILNVDGYRLDRVVNSNKYVIQEHEIIDFYSRRNNYFANKNKQVDNPKTDMVQIFNNTYEQLVLNDEWALTRALVTSLYFSEFYKSSKNLMMSNLGFSSNLQKKLTEYYVAQIINFGNTNIINGLVKIPDSIYNQKASQKVFYDIYNGLGVSISYNLIIYIFSILTNKRIYVKTQKRLYSVFPRSVLEYKTIPIFFSKIEPSSICINIHFNDNLNIDNISSIFKVYNTNE